MPSLPLSILLRGLLKIWMKKRTWWILSSRKWMIKDDIHTAYEKLYKVSKKHEKLYKLATKKLSDV